MVWIEYLLQDLGITAQMPIHMHCDNLTDIFVSENHTLHECTKLGKIDCHFIHDKVSKGAITTPHVPYSDQLVNIFAKSINGKSHRSSGAKLGMLECSAWRTNLLPLSI